MTTKEVRAILKDHNIPYTEFILWMDGQTVGGTPKNPDWYEYDVERFVKGDSPMSHG